jgi:hypothetical protein
MRKSLKVLQVHLEDLKTNAESMPHTNLGKDWSTRISKILDTMDKEDHIKHLTELRASLVILKEKAEKLIEENRKEGYSAKFQKAIDSLDDYEKACKDYDPHLLGEKEN